MKRLIWILALILLAWWIVTAPESAAHTARELGTVLSGTARGLASFFAAL